MIMSYNRMRVIQERDGSNYPQVAYTRGLDLSGTFEGAGGIGGLLARSHDFTNCNNMITYWLTNNSGYCITELSIWDEYQTILDTANIQPGETWSYSFPAVAGRHYWIWGYSCDEYYIQAYVDGFDGTLEYYGADFDTNGTVTATQWGQPLCDGGTSGVWLTHNYYHADGNGNITCLVAPNDTVTASYRYDPFGNTLSQSGGLATANTYRFSSKEIHAATGLYYYGYRFYAPNLQRWVNRDPLGEEGSLVVRVGQSALYLVPELQTWGEENLFHYVMNDPVSRVDYFGLQMVGPPGSGLPSWGPAPQGPPWWKTHGYKSAWDCIKDCVAMSTGLGTVPGAIACKLGGPVGLAYTAAVIAGCTANCNGVDHY